MEEDSDKEQDKRDSDNEEEFSDADADEDDEFVVKDKSDEAVDNDYERNENDDKEEEGEEDKEDKEDKRWSSEEAIEQNKVKEEDSNNAEVVNTDAAVKIQSTDSDEDEPVDNPRGPSYDDILDRHRNGIVDVYHHYRKDQHKLESFAFHHKVQHRKIGKISNNPDDNTLKWEAVGLNNGKKFVNGVELPSNKKHSP